MLLDLILAVENIILKTNYNFLLLLLLISYENIQIVEFPYHNSSVIRNVRMSNSKINRFFDPP